MTQTKEQTTQQLAKALLIPLPDQLNRQQLNKLDKDKIEDKIELDFNPDTLTLNVQNGQEKDRGRRGKQQTQFVGNTTATLSFQAIFDSTRPKEVTHGQAPQSLDVRVKTSKIANLMQDRRKGKKSAPQRVRFCWGTVIFDGLIKSYSETLDYFSSDGIPLRSKVSISITEQRFEYQVNADAILPQTQPPAANGGAVAPSTDTRPVDGLGSELGLNTNLAASSNAGIHLTNQQALEVFGGAAVSAAFTAEVDLGLISNISPPPHSRVDDNRPNTSWAPQGPTPATAASDLASLVNQARAMGFSDNPMPDFDDSFSASTSASVQTIAKEGSAPLPSQAATPIESGGIEAQKKPLPVRGSPPLVAARFGKSATVIYQENIKPVAAKSGERRPSWEVLPDTESTDTPKEKTVCCHKGFRKW